MDNRFCKDDFVVYGKNGVCFIEDIRTMDFAGEKGEYYVLRPKSNGNSTVYVPLAKEELVSKMRPVMTKDEIDSLLESAMGKEIEWIDAKNLRLETFNGILSGGNSRDLLLLVGCIYMKKQEKLAAGKRLSSTDENILKSAERLVEEEFSFALRCSADRVVSYIKNKLKIDE
ncbi:MAG: hypothetical protein J6D26_01895 [Clostridia bacterium]|nr:hypothetical protein [Clostridia bacterium]